MREFLKFPSLKEIQRKEEKEKMKKKNDEEAERKEDFRVGKI